jgi:hypothetical protein
MRRLMMAGFTVAVGGAAALAVVAYAGLPTVWAFASLGLLGFGLGPVASTSIIAPQSRVAWSHRGAVTAVVFASRMLGGSIAVAALGALGDESHPAAARFVGVALLAAGGAISMGLLAPRSVHMEPGDTLGAAAE